MKQIKVELQDFLGNDRSISEAAWTSNFDYQKKKSRTDEDVKRVVTLLANEKHSVPFESVVFRFWIKLPIAIDRQLMTHRIACLSGDNELYFDLPKTGSSRFKLFKMKLGTFVDKWNNGVTSKTRWGGNTKKQHRNRLKQMKLRSVNEETGEIQYNKVKNVYNNGIQPVFKFTFENGYEIKSTLNHQYLTKAGWSTIGNALGLKETLTETPKTFLASSLFSVNGKFAYKDYDTLKNLREKKYSLIDMSNELGVSTHTIRKWLRIHKLQFNLNERSFPKGHRPWNAGLTYKHNKPYNLTDEDRKNKSIQASGSNSNFWRGGITPEKEKLRRECSTVLAKERFKLDNYKCTNCGNKENLNAHHIIPVYADILKIKDINNLTTLCTPCHKYIHANHLEEQFAESRSVSFKSKKPFPKIRKKIREFVKIEKVEFIGFEETYDIEVHGPYHNFVCNGVVVHNSHSGMSGRYRTMPREYLETTDDVDDIMSKIQPHGHADSLDIFEAYYEACEKSNAYYTKAVEYAKVAEKSGIITNQEYKRLREFYRGILPQHNMTERVSVINLRSFANFIKLRNKPNAQAEIKYLAELMLQAVKDKNVCPIAIEVLEQNNWII